jgi:hypothetical protein
VPWWFWVLAVLWSLPLLALLAAVAWECYDARLYEQMVQRESPLTTQCSNPRSRG